jgi:DNA-binding NtrC family response regulator
MPSRPLRLLLVDDEPNVTDAYRRELRRLRPEWVVWTAKGAEEASKLLLNGVDVLVSDIGMAPFTGLDLLQWTLQACPGVLRVVVSGLLDGSTLTGVRDLAQVHLCKPFPAARLPEEIESALAARGQKR